MAGDQLVQPAKVPRVQSVMHLRMVCEHGANRHKRAHMCWKKSSPSDEVGASSLQLLISFDLDVDISMASVHSWT